MTAYENRKEKARELAFEFQHLFFDGVSLSWEELAEWTDKLYRVARSAGLIREFRENAII